MRWKFFRDTQSMYTCLWCCHVKLGSLLLGISSLLLQLTILSVVIVAFFNPGAVPSWISSFVTPSNINESQNVNPLHDLPQRVNHDRMMHHVGGPQSDHHKGMMGSDMMADEHTSVESDEDEEDVGITENDFISKKNGTLARSAVGMMGMKPVDDTDPLGAVNMPVDKADMQDMMQMPVGMDDMYPKQLTHLPELSSSGVDSPSHHAGQMDSDDKFLVFVILVGSIFASLMLIKGVIKSQPSYLMPYMGLQVFEFSVTGLTVFSCFSYVPDIKHWISVQPDSLPLKSYLLSVDTDRLILGTILLSVSVLVMKAYFMGIVWSCYKYLVQSYQEATRGRRRLVEDDMRNPEDAELLLPPKYEDIVNTPASNGDSNPPPPPYQSA